MQGDERYERQHTICKCQEFVMSIETKTSELIQVEEVDTESTLSIVLINTDMRTQGLTLSWLDLVKESVSDTPISHEIIPEKFDITSDPLRYKIGKIIFYVSDTLLSYFGDRYNICSHILAADDMEINRHVNSVCSSHAGENRFKKFINTGNPNVKYGSDIAEILYCTFKLLGG